MFRITLQLRASLLALAILGGPLSLLAAEKKATPPPPPPQPVPQKIKVLRDSPVDIPLRIYGRKNQPVTFLIRRQPAAGKLSTPKNTELEAAVVQYRAPADVKITRETFDYAAKSDQGVSAPATIEIEIIDAPPALISPVEVVFGPLLTGKSDKQTIELENQGGRIAEGDLFVGPPWRIEVSNHYRIEPGQRRSVALTFAPEKPGDYETELRFTSQPDRVTTLRGKAYAALEAKPATVTLEAVTGALVRAAALEVTNHSAEQQSIRVTTPDRLVSDGSIDLAPEQSGTLMIRTKDGEIGPIAAEITLESGSYRTVVPVRAEALPGIVQAEATQLELRVIPPSPEPMATLIVRNLGGQVARGELASDAEFQLSATRVELLVGAEARIEVRLASGITPPIDGTIQLKSGGATQRIAVSAKASAVAATAHPRSEPSRSSKSTPRETVSTSEPDNWSPYDQDITKPIDPIQIIRTVGVTPTSCTLEWEAERSSAKAFLAETRSISIVDGQLSRQWHQYPAFHTTLNGSKMRGTFDQLQTGRQYTVRVRGLEENGQPGATVFEASFTTQFPEADRKKRTWKYLLTFGGVGAVLVLLWHRSRVKGVATVDPKKTQKMV